VLTKEQALTAITINCYDAVIMTQLIEKSLRNGLITGKELSTVAGLRGKLATLILVGVGVDIDDSNLSGEVPNNNAE
jgi:hypothetical protein